MKRCLIPAFLAVMLLLTVLGVTPVSALGQDTDATPAAGTGESRESLLPFGEGGEVGAFRIRVAEVTPDARAEILAASPINSPPTEGNQFYMVGVEIVYTGEESIDPAYALNFQSVGQRNRGYEAFNADCGLPPEPVVQVGEMFEGATAEFNVCWQIDVSDADSLVMYVDPFLSSGDENRAWFSLDAPATPQGTPSPSATEPTATGSIELEAVDITWSQRTLTVTPGQKITVTNTGVLPHDFSVDEWNMRVDLPNGQPVEIQVPADAEPGSGLVFYCSKPGHRQAGMEGVITVEEGG